MKRFTSTKVHISDWKVFPKYDPPFNTSFPLPATGTICKKFVFNKLCFKKKRKESFQQFPKIFQNLSYCQINIKLLLTEKLMEKLSCNFFWMGIQKSHYYSKTLSFERFSNFYTFKKTEFKISSNQWSC